MARFILEDVPLFQELNKKEVAFISQFLIEKKYSQFEKIFTKNTTRDKIIIITEGQVVLRSNFNNREIIALFKEGNFLGELTFLQKHSKHRYHLEASSMIVKTLELSIYNWHSIIKRQPPLANKIYQNIGLALDDRLYHANNKLAALFATGKIIGSYQKLDEIAKEILKILLQIIPSNKALLATFSSDTQKMYVHQAVGYNKIKHHTSYDVSKDNLLKNLLTQPKTTIVTKENFKIEYALLPYISDSLIITPIKVKDKIIGFIMLADKMNRRHFSTNNKILLEAIANQTAPAIQQINLKKLASAEAEIKEKYIDPFAQY